MNFHKILVMNSKGGSGKSTVATQVVLPWLFTRTHNQKIALYYEFDDENDHSWPFQNSVIATSIPVQVSQTDLRTKVTDILLQKECSVCIDVGANKTSIALQQALFDTGMIHAIDVVIIPIMDGEVDALNAIALAKAVREASDVPILFALNRHNEMRELESQFNLFLGDKREFLQEDGLINQLPLADRDYFVMRDSDAIKYSRLFGVTLWEVSLLDKDFDGEIRSAMRNSNINSDEIRFMSFKKGIYQDCLNYNDDVLAPIFRMLDSVVDNNTIHLIALSTQD
jgi:hypothetical protein